MLKELETAMRELGKTYHRLDGKTRRAKIRWLVRNGGNGAEIARMLGMSRQRVHQLAHASQRN